MPPILKLMSGLPLIMVCSQVECKESAKPLTSEMSGYELPLPAALWEVPLRGGVSIFIFIALLLLIFHICHTDTDLRSGHWEPATARQT